MKKLVFTITSIFTLFALLAPSLVYAASPASSTPAPTAAVVPKDAVCEGVGLVTGAAGCDDVKGAPTVNSTLAVAINLFSLIVGITAVIMVIIGGFKYVTSSGDSARVSSAKDTILYAIVGLVVVAMAQVIVKFVLNKATAPPPTPSSSAAQQIGDQVGKQAK